MSTLTDHLEFAKRQLQNMDMPNAAGYVDAAIARIAELERQLAEAIAEIELEQSVSVRWKARAEQAEQRIAESQRQEPYAWIWRFKDEEEWHLSIGAACPTFRDECITVDLWSDPIITPTVEEAAKAAMLVDALKELKSAAWRTPVEQLMYQGNRVVRKANDALHATAADSEAFIRQKQAEAVKDAMVLLLNHGEDHDWRIMAKNMGNGSLADLRNAKEV